MLKGTAVHLLGTLPKQRERVRKRELGRVAAKSEVVKNRYLVKVFVHTYMHEDTLGTRTVVGA